MSPATYVSHWALKNSYPCIVNLGLSLTSPAYTTEDHLLAWLTMAQRVKANNYDSLAWSRCIALYSSWLMALHRRPVQVYTNTRTCVICFSIMLCQLCNMCFFSRLCRGKCSDVESNPLRHVEDQTAWMHNNFQQKKFMQIVLLELIWKPTIISEVAEF